MRKFNEQANEEAGDHFTPREVIRLMVQLLFTGEDGIYEKGIYRSVYDPTAGTGGMLSESEKFICGDGFSTGRNPDAHIELFGQEYNPESYAICCADLLIKELVRLYAEHEHDAHSDVLMDGKLERRIGSKVFDNRDFGFLKITVERPLRLNFQASTERIAKLTAKPKSEMKSP